MQRESLNTREQSREDKGEDGERKNATTSVECQRGCAFKLSLTADLEFQRVSVWSMETSGC